MRGLFIVIPVGVLIGEAKTALTEEFLQGHAGCSIRIAVEDGETNTGFFSFQTADRLKIRVPIVGHTFFSNEAYRPVVLVIASLLDDTGERLIGHAIDVTIG